MTVLIVVTHLLGTGHLRRAATLARAFAAAGHRAIVVTGGTPVAGLDLGDAALVQLPPLKSDGTQFTTLLTDTGAHADAGYLAMRKAALLETLQSAPDVLITELFPFGRRVLSDEFTDLLERAQKASCAPVILASIRDILAPPSKPAKVRVTEELIRRYYDGVLVHSDETVVPLSASWPVGPGLAEKLRYTGFVAPPLPVARPENPASGEVLVSAGGGAVGDPLFAAALRAARVTPERQWRVLVGGTDPGARVARLRAEAPANVLVEPARRDFRHLLQNAACSVSMAGYNTALDILQTGVPALFVPFDEGGEVEQSIRAKTLAELPGIEMLAMDEATPDAMATTVAGLIGQPRRSVHEIAMDGAARSVEIARQLRMTER